MSLINDVLRDLDRRHANAADRQGIPNDVRPLPPASPATNLKLWAIVLASGVGMVILAIALWRANPVAVDAPVPVPVATSAEPPSAVPQRLTLAEPPTPANTEKTLPAAAKADIAAPAPKLQPTPIKSALVATVVPNSPEPKQLKLARDIKLPQVEATAGSFAESKPAVAGSSPVTKVANDDWARAQVLIKAGRADEAEPLIKHVLESQPTLLAPRQALLGILLPARRFADAIPVLTTGLAHFPEQTSWAMNLARLHVDAGDYPAAWEALAISLDHAQQQPDYLAFAGTVSQRLGKSADAVGHYQAALRLRPEESRWWVGLGIALESSGHPAEAKAAFQRAKSLGNFSPDIAKFLDQKLQ